MVSESNIHGDVRVQDRFVHLTINGEQAETLTYKFPLIWLRDNCQCSECYHPTSGSRIIRNWENFRYNVSTKSAVVCYKEKKIHNLTTNNENACSTVHQES